MQTRDFDYLLPPELIAQSPLEPRDHSRLMVLNRERDSLEHRRFFEITEYLRPGDVLVFNDSRVIPARLKGSRAGSGGRVEILLLHRREEGLWEALVKPGKRLRPGSRIELDAAGSRTTAEVTDEGEDGIKTLRFTDESLLSRLGEVPLPPYIHTPLERPERYQTVYARADGSAAAPTAGLHFTPELLHRIEQKGVHCHFVTLHVGLDTFRPVREEDPRQHRIHREYAELNQETAAALTRARQEGRRIICVGTTAVRIAEQAAQLSSPESLQPFRGWVSLFILPGYRFRMVDAMITNFHLPRSTLLMLVSAFAGTEAIRRAYEEAISRRYRFFSFGDAMLIA